MSLQGHHLEGSLTAGLILAPGLASCCLELREMWRGRGSCLLAGLYLLLCPLWVLLTHLYSIFNPRWQSKALMLKSMEGFLCAAPQLVLQLALWLRGSLTSPSRWFSQTTWTFSSPPRSLKPWQRRSTTVSR